MLNALRKIAFLLCLLPTLAKSETFPQRLTGPWDLYPCQLLTPASPLPANSIPMRTGQSWQLEGCGNGKSHGYGTYRYQLPPLEARDGGYQIGLKVAFSAFRMFVFPESQPELAQEVQSGLVGETEDTMLPAYQARTIQIAPASQSEKWIVMIQVSNFQHVRGGLSQPPLLGLGHSLTQEFQREWESAILCIGFMLFMLIYSLMLYFRRKEDKASLCLSFTCLMFICRVIPTSNLIYYYVQDPTAWLFRLHFCIEYGGLVGASTFYLLFNHYTFRAKSSELGVKILYRIGLAAIVLCIVAPVPVMTSCLRVLQVIAIAQMSMVITTLVRSIRAKHEGARLAGFGDLALIACAIYDVLMSSAILPRTVYMTQYGAGAFLFIQSQLVVQRFAKAFRTAERLQKELQIEVERQTEELSSMMQNIPQGVFVILQDLSIQGNYSLHLETILSTRDLSGQLALKALFGECSLSQELIDGVASALVASLGEDAVVWDMNSGNLPREFLRKRGDRTQILELDWNPIVNREDRIQRVLVTVRDVTQVKTLQEESQRRKAEFDMILEMVQADRESLVSFFEQGRQLLQAAQEMREGRQAFIKLHTLKGLARSYGLRRLTARVHELEQSLVQEQQEQWVHWDQEKFQASVQGIRLVFDEYTRLLREKLRWQDHGASGREFSLEELLELERHARNWDPARIQKAVERILQKHLYHGLRDMIAGFHKDVKNLAAELQKPEPQFVIDGPELHMSTTADALLRQALLHLINNAMDHGIETAAERQATGKNPLSVIRVEARMERSEFRLTFEDDGRGLHLESIHRLATERGLLPTQTNPDTLAEILFIPGFSTKTASTEVSGRGVGMDAVRESFRQLGGTVRIEVLSPVPDVHGCVPFRIVCQLPAMHFLQPLPAISQSA